MSLQIRLQRGLSGGARDDDGLWEENRVGSGRVAEFLGTAGQLQERKEVDGKEEYRKWR